MADLPIVGGAGDKAGEAAGGVKGTLTRKVGPLPLWAYALIAGGLVLAFRLYTGSAGSKKGTVSTVTAATDAGGGGGGNPSSVGTLRGPVVPEPLTPVPTTQTPSASPVSTPLGPTVTRAPIVSPAIPASRRIDTSTGGARVGGGESSVISSLGVVLSQVTGTRAQEIGTQSGSIIQYINGIPISLSSEAVARGGVSGANIVQQTATSK